MKTVSLKSLRTTPGSAWPARASPCAREPGRPNKKNNDDNNKKKNTNDNTNNATTTTTTTNNNNNNDDRPSGR